jgi:hypothetical protein
VSTQVSSLRASLSNPDNRELLHPELPCNRLVHPDLRERFDLFIVDTKQSISQECSKHLKSVKAS